MPWLWRPTLGSTVWATNPGIGQCYRQRLRFLFWDGFGCWGKSEVPKLWNESKGLAYTNSMSTDEQTCGSQGFVLAGVPSLVSILCTFACCLLAAYAER